MSYNNNSSIAVKKYFLKGDISGIQEFIFNVKSEKAARVLKARSIFIQVFSEFAISYIERELVANSIEIFTNGGGSFYLDIHSGKNYNSLKLLINRIEKNINVAISQENLYLVLSIVDTEYKEFSAYWTDVAIESNKDKQNKYSNDFDAFKPFQFSDENLNWLDFAHWFPKSEASLSSLDDKQALSIYNKGISLFYEELRLGSESGMESNYNETALLKKIRIRLPRWNRNLFNSPKYREWIEEENKDRDVDKIREGHIIDYKFLAGFANERTGTNKLGILKMDVDSLGLLFSGISDRFCAQKVSKKLSDFFGISINELLEEPLNYDKYKIENFYPSRYLDNIYTIFSGGDDCIFVGGWDAIFDWALLIQEKFELVALEIEKIIKDENIESSKKISLPPTISAGIIVLEPTYPVIRFADLSDKAIEEAKGFKFFNELINKKNKIFVFGQVLSWEEFEKAQELAKILQENIEDDSDSKSLIERIRMSAEAFGKLQERALVGKSAGPNVAKLFYFIRNKSQATALVAQIIEPYAQDLLNAFVLKKPTNPMKYPVAARWAEFLTRKN